MDLKKRKGIQINRGQRSYKFSSLILCRFIAVISVIYYHLISYNPSAKPFIGPIADRLSFLDYKTACNLVFCNYVNLGEIGVSLFFLLSGFLICKSRREKNIKKFIQRRVLRIYPVAIFGVLISYTVVLFCNKLLLDLDITFKANDLLVILGNVFLISGLIPIQLSDGVFETNVICPHFWFLSVICVYYILMSFMVNVTSKNVLLFTLSIATISLVYVITFDSNFFKEYPYIKTIISFFVFSFIHIIYIFIGSCIYLLITNSNHF